jgi:CheY-like chemotaxis protein
MANSQIQETSHGRLILVVEDSPVQALAVTKCLEEEGLSVMCAPNGRAGVSLAQRYQPDVIVLDIAMPEMNGLEACRLLKQHAKTAGIPIVLLTAHSDLETAGEGLDLGAIDFIPKDDFSQSVLLETLRQMGMVDAAQGRCAGTLRGE